MINSYGDVLTMNFPRSIMKEMPDQEIQDRLFCLKDYDTYSQHTHISPVESALKAAFHPVFPAYDTLPLQKQNVYN